MSKQKKTQQLGMNPSTASGRLVKDLLFKFAVEAGHKCHRCGEALDRKTFSIEHIKDWLNSEDPAGLFFDLDNIAFSHLSCNSAASSSKKYFTEEERTDAKAKYTKDRNIKRMLKSPEERKTIRREQYLRTGS